jgi:hypothetical protein
MRGGGEGGAARARESQEEGENGARREVAGRRDGKSRGGVGGAVVPGKRAAGQARVMGMGVAQQDV